jgi:rhodanese-related sulfurtransferase
MAINEIEVDELAERLADTSAPTRLIDVREPDEYEAGHVPGAELIPLGEVADRVNEFRSDGQTYVICRSGARSMRACELASDHGIDVVNVSGGTMAWMLAGHDVETGHP